MLKKSDLMELLSRYQDVIEVYHNHYCDNGQLSFNVKLGKIDSGTVIEDYKKKYADNKEVLEAIQDFENDIDSVFEFYIQDKRDYAVEYFVQQCCTYSKDYFVEHYKEGKFPYCTNLKTAIRWDKKEELERRAFDKIIDLNYDGRQGGYMIMDYKFCLDTDVIDEIIDMLEEKEMSVKQFYEDYSVKAIREDIKDIELIAEHVQDLKNGVESGWKDEIQFRLDEEIQPILNAQRVDTVATDSTVSNTSQNLHDVFVRLEGGEEKNLTLDTDTIKKYNNINRCIFQQFDKDKVLSIAVTNQNNNYTTYTYDRRLEKFCGEYRRVEINYKHNNHLSRERCYIGRSTGWIPCYLSLKTDSSTGGQMISVGNIITVKAV